MNEHPPPRPPNLADAFLAWFCAPDLREEIQGDLHELFERRWHRYGLQRARLYYWLDVLRFFRPSVIRHRQQDYATARGPIMLTNYLKIALRNWQRQKGYAFINVAGLAVGMACCLLILLYVRNELRYDTHHENAERVFRLTADYNPEGSHWAPIGPPVGPALLASIPEVEQVARIFPFERSVIFRHEDRQFDETGVVYADSTVFVVFTLPLVRGTPETALNRSNTVVLSQSIARRFFEDTDPLGRTLSVPGWVDLTVTGVMADLPPTTHLPFDVMVSMQTFYENAGDWVERARTWAGFLTYALLREADDAETVATKLPDFINTFYEGVFEEGIPADQMRLVLQPIRDIHLHSKLEKEYRANSDITYIYIFSVIALVILLIACINFINLATARAMKRMREVGVRKAMGARRSQLVRQFLGESVLTTLAALLLAGGLIALVLPAFNQLTGKALALADLQQPSLLAVLAGMTLLTGLISGIYPAFVLAGFQPTRALRGTGGTAAGSAWLRKGLVVFQFGTSIFLIAGTLVVWSQLDYFQTKQLGFGKERIIKVRLSGALHEAVTDNLATFKQELLRNPALKHISLAADVPGERYSLESITMDGQQNDDGTMVRIAWGVDHDYLKALDIELAAGRDFSLEAPADTNAWIINEAAVQRLGLEEPIGTVLRWGDYAGPVVGVVRNFHFASLHHEIEPLVIPLRPGVGSMLLMRVEVAEMASVLPYIEAELDRLVPDQLFRYSILSDDFDQLYQGEDKLRDIFGYFSGIAIFIACLGLFGLAAFTAEQRTKEIGVRKALGASVGGIMVLLSKDYLRLVALAFVIAAPLAYFAMNRWLEDFAYRIDISWPIFLLAGLAALGVALATVSYQSIKAAKADPVKALRYE